MAVQAIAQAAPVSPTDAPVEALQPPASRSAAGVARWAFAALLGACALLTAAAALHTAGGVRAAVLALGGATLLGGGLLARAALQRLQDPLAVGLHAARKLAAGDLTGSIGTARGTAGQLLDALRQTQNRLFAIVSEVRTGTTGVAAASSEISRDAAALAERTDTQVHSIQQTAASMEEFAAAVRHNADSAARANELVSAASSRAAHGGALMHQVVETMGSIRSASRSVTDITGVIDAIAFQTNILALNAAVEASRAGDHGRGFGVVAGEVRTLSQRCAQAAREIKGLVTTSVQQVDAGGRLVEEAGRSMAEIVDSVQQVADLIRRISASSREQSAGIDAINEAIAQLERTTQRNADLVEGARRSAVLLNERAVALLRSVSGFTLGTREYGTAEEAVAMVQRACEFHAARGRQALLDEINRLGQGQFVDRDLYLMAIDPEARFLAHGNNPRVLGQGPKSRDVDGRLFVQEMVRAAARRGGAWVDYKWAHPVTNEVLTKRTWVQRAGDLVIGCGIYAS